MFFSIGFRAILGRTGQDEHVFLSEADGIASLLTTVLGKRAPTKPLPKGRGWASLSLALRLLSVRLGTGAQRLSSQVKEVLEL